jgi:hypothetical protein
VDGKSWCAVGLTPLVLLAARLQADSYWHGPPACGDPVMAAQRLDPNVFAEADFDGCRIVFNDVWRRWPWPAVCTLAIHEAGHLHGLTHESDRWVMSSHYRGSLRVCRTRSPWLADNFVSDWPD